jgi:hypothetical protein
VTIWLGETKYEPSRLVDGSSSASNPVLRNIEKKFPMKPVPNVFLAANAVFLSLMIQLPSSVGTMNGLKPSRWPMSDCATVESRSFGTLFISIKQGSRIEASISLPQMSLPLLDPMYSSYPGLLAGIRYQYAVCSLLSTAHWHIAVWA